MDRITGLARCAGVAALLFLLPGCFVFGERHQVDEPLPHDAIQGIRRGVTTRQEVLERFGPPTAVARRGATMVYPPPGPGKRGRMDVQADTFLELFSVNRPLRDEEVTYYYDSSRIKAIGFLIIPVIGGGYNSKRVAVERLWLLIDGSTGIVEDYVFRGED
jgi:hypothetical protein